jgi:glycosyltransferase involved in cell wall biosynthesis
MTENSAADRGRVLLVVSSMEFGGAEGQVAMLAERLKARGWAVDVFLLHKTGTLVEHLERAGVLVDDGGYPPKGSKIRKAIGICLCQARLIRRIWRWRPDIVHGFLPITSFMSAVAGRLNFVARVIISKRSLAKYQDREPKFKWLDRLANALADTVTANSEAVARATEARDGYDASRILVVYNGLDFERLDKARPHREETRAALSLSGQDIAVGMVANLIPYKGHRELIEAFASVAARDPRLKLFLIGRDDGIGQTLTESAARLGVADRVNLMGPRSDVPRLLSAMDIGVLSSHEEGFSNALLEKLAAGLPVVATDVGGNPEVLKGMPGCVLVRPQDAGDLARGLSDAIGGLGTDDSNRKVRQDLVRERYSVDAMVDAYERMYLRKE